MIYRCCLFVAATCELATDRSKPATVDRQSIINIWQLGKNDFEQFGHCYAFSC